MRSGCAAWKPSTKASASRRSSPRRRAREIVRGAIVGVEELGAELDRHRRQGIADGEEAPADALARLEHHDVDAASGEIARRREPGQAGAHDDHVRTAGSGHEEAPILSTGRA